MAKFTKEEDKFLLDNYLKIPAKRMSVMLGRSESSARQRMKLLGIVVPPEVVERFRKESQFSKGHVPVNKGKPMSEQTRQKVARTWFPKGNLPANTAPKDGTITIRTDKTGRKYKFIRIAIGKWVPLHQYRWEQRRGPIPAGMHLWFKDGNSLNCTMKNLELVTRAENIRRNTIQRYPKEVQLAMKRISKINKKLKCLETKSQT